MENVVLIGFMGTGKTVVARRLSKLLNKKFIDTDLEIERVTGMTANQIVKKYGSVRFHSEESLALKRILNSNNLIISTGYDIVQNKENLDLIKKNGKVVCLTATPEKVKERIEKRDHRPLMKSDKSLEKVKEMLNENEKYYSEAEVIVDTTNLSVDEVVNYIYRKLSN